MEKIELLAPAGNMESLIAAVSAGCDAVYLGLQTFSARAFAGNFSHEEYLEAIEYCHVRGVKVYVTLNTLLTNKEFQNIIKEVEFLYENDVDAILIQDLGLFHYIHTRFPDLEIHCSTQMHIHNLDGTRFIHKMGASRIVIARETPIQLIQEMCKEGLEIEVFGYGALCISYSGQCLMSSAIKNRSGNKGMCAQLCRLKYKGDDGKYSYLLSPKDLNIINSLPEIIEAGVSSIKIEGRMKRKEYVYLVTKLFRKAIDAYYDQKDFQLSEEDTKELLLMFNRGFTKGHLFNDSIDEHMSQYRPNHLGITIGKVLDYKDGKVLVKLSDILYQHDGLRILNEQEDIGLTAVKIYKNNKLVHTAYPNEEVWLECKEKPYPKKGQLLQKTTDTVLLKRIQDEIKENKRKISLNLSFKCIKDKPFYITIQKDNETYEYHSDYIVQTAKNAPLTKERIIEQLLKTDEYPYDLKIDGIVEDAFLPINQINEFRRHIYQSLYKTLGKIHTRQYLTNEYTFTLTPKDLPSYRLIIQNGIQSIQKDDVLYLETNKNVFDVVNENGYSSSNIQYSLINEIGSLNQSLTHCIAGMGFNITNSYACAFLYALEGIDGIILSSELNEDSMIDIINELKNQYNVSIPLYQLNYGRRTLMNIKKSFTTQSISSIRDIHGVSFPVIQDHNVTKILESESFIQEKQICYGSFVLFTLESDTIKKEVERKYYEKLHE